jgi:2Fe-2S ferredoxin
LPRAAWTVRFALRSRVGASTTLPASGVTPNNMPRITVLPHAEICPQGAEFETASGVSVADALLDHHVDIEHACGKVAACTTCHCIIRKGFNSLPLAEDTEEDLLDRAWGLTSVSRLSCQAIVQNEDLTIEIPKYSINHAKEIEQKESS